MLILRVLAEDPLLHQRAEDQRGVRDQDDGEVPGRRVGDQERNVGHQVTGVDRVPHERIRPAHDHATVGRDDAEAAAEDILPTTTIISPAADTSAVTTSGASPAGPLARSSDGPASETVVITAAAADRSTMWARRRGDGQYDDERLAGKQQQPGDRPVRM